MNKLESLTMESKRAGRPVGRPSLAEVRRLQVLDAYLELIAERGLRSVTLDDVATAAGVQRTVIRHYVGNRSELLVAATHHLIGRYTESIRDRLGVAPSPRRLLDVMFSRTWSTATTIEDRALDELFREATRDEGTRVLLRGAYQLLIDEIADSLIRERPSLRRGLVEHVAYQIVCLAEHNGALQQLGFPVQQARAVRRLADQLIARASAEPD